MPSRDRFGKLLQVLRVAARWCLILIVLPFVLIVLPIAIPIIFIVDAFEKRRMMRAAERSVCSRCGNRLGREAVEEARCGFHQSTVGFGSDSPMVCAVCLTAGCGAKLTYCKELNSFVLIAADETSGA